MTIYMDVWTPLSIVKLGWYVNIRSVQVKELGKIWVGSESNYCKPKVIVSESIFKPSFSVMSSFHNDSYQYKGWSWLIDLMQNLLNFLKKTVKFTSCLTRGTIYDSDKIEPEKYVVFISYLGGQL